MNGHNTWPRRHERMTARELAAALADRAEEVCRRYLPGGRKEGRYWKAGNVHGDAGRSLFVGLAPSALPGRWQDAATGEGGDLLVLLRRQFGDAAFADSAGLRRPMRIGGPVSGRRPRPAGDRHGAADVGHVRPARRHVGGRLPSSAAHHAGSRPGTAVPSGALLSRWVGFTGLPQAAGDGGPGDESSRRLRRRAPHLPRRRPSGEGAGGHAPQVARCNRRRRRLSR